MTLVSRPNAPNIPVPQKLQPYALLLQEILESPEGYKPYIIYQEADHPSGEQYHSLNCAMPTLFASSGVGLHYEAMFNPQEYFFTEATMAAREFVNYMREFADLIESRLPELPPAPVGSHGQDGNG